MKHITSKIVEVMRSVDCVAKDAKNSFQNYKYASDVAIVTAIRGAIIEQGLVLIPNQKARSKDDNLITVEVEYTILDSASGESVTATSFGDGMDKGDKGLYKAVTGAEKYFLLKTFLLPTPDDAEQHSPEPKKEPKKEPVKTEPSKTPIRDLLLENLASEFGSKKKAGQWTRGLMGEDFKVMTCTEEEAANIQAQLDDLDGIPF